LRKTLVKWKDLVFDTELYPRFKLSWLTAHQYAQTMKSGVEFPPVLVGRFEGKLYLIDGWHRVEAKKNLKDEYVQAQVKNYPSRREMFLDAIKLNIAHGRPLSVQERVRLIEKLKGMRFELEQISEVLHAPVEDVKLLSARVVYGPDGQPIYAKGLTAHLATDETSIMDLDQSTFSVRNVSALLKQLIAILEHPDVYPIQDEDVKELTAKAHGLLVNILKSTPLEETVAR